MGNVNLHRVSENESDQPLAIRLILFGSTDNGHSCTVVHSCLGRNIYHGW